jgi:hypothetical protein
MFHNVTLPIGTTYPVNITDVPNANLTASNDGRLEVMSNSRDGGFGIDVVCFANNTDGSNEDNFLVRFLKGVWVLRVFVGLLTCICFSPLWVIFDFYLRPQSRSYVFIPYVSVCLCVCLSAVR